MPQLTARDLGADRVLGQRSRGQQLVDGDAQRDPGAGNGGGAGAAVGLDHVAVDDDLPLAKLGAGRPRRASERPISRWISCVRPDCLPLAASRLPRVWVARGSIPYSAVTQPWPLPRRNGGTFSSTEAVTSTRVSPKLTRQLPSAWRVKPGSKRKFAHLVGGAAAGAHAILLITLFGAALDRPSLAFKWLRPTCRRMNEPIGDLTDRMRDIFRLVVEAYLDRGQPVGSKALAGAVSLSPASIRGVMQELEERGLLTHPHTSAGRIPTETGLRLFVDGIMHSALPRRASGRRSRRS